jgi:hypothetical protein
VAFSKARAFFASSLLGLLVLTATVSPFELPYPAEDIEYSVVSAHFPAFRFRMTRSGHFLTTLTEWVHPSRSRSGGAEPR